MKATRQLFHLLVVSSFLGLAAVTAEPVLVVNKSLEGESFDAATVKAVFLGKKVAWDTGGRASLAVIRKGDSADEFLKKYTGLSASAFGNQWRRLAMTGGGIAPKSFNSDAEVVEYVATTEGAVGFAERSATDDSVIVLSP